MRFLNLVLPLFVISALFVGNAMYQNDLNRGQMRDINNLTSKIRWEYNYTLENTIDSEHIIAYRISNIIYKGIDFLGFTSFEAMKSGIEFGYSNPQYDYAFAFGMMKLVLIAIIVRALIPISIPLLAVITIVGMGICNLIKKLSNSKTKENTMDEIE